MNVKIESRQRLCSCGEQAVVAGDNGCFCQVHRWKALRPERLPSPIWNGEIEEEDAYLDVIFRRFNRVTEEDCYWLGEVGYRLPSLSVGDRVTLAGKTWECRPAGWAEVEG